MPSHFHFSFGLGKYLGFKLKLGSRDSGSSRSDPRSGAYDAEMAKKSGIIVYTDSKPAPKPKPQSGCPLFTAIPVEIRHLIYRELLTTPEVIDQAHKQLGNKESAMLEHYKPIPGIDSPILRTCRLIYIEALPILYGLNTFHFSSAQCIRHFQNHGLSTFPLDLKVDNVLAFNFKSATTGRLQMIRSLVLELKSDYRVYTRNTNVSYTRDNIWRDWSISLFNDDRDSIYGWGSNNLSFPQLEKLTLDFTEWQLTENDGVLVKPFIKKLRPSDGLHELVLKGYKHQPTIEQFRSGLVREGGMFSLINPP
ncbi:MAG: hypothetical protein OHK93_005722 [Ramalina farinacea]|uniref:Uncharacterized protein n=1 Tax=Ramalina farinacea TaxID=258253 RepID=A0AA43QH91_9LECA|nr:hypothetical protein [Ramalina farinacea]